MRITKIKANNFKSFDGLELDFADFNVIIGANASGKSNFLSLIKFLKDIESWGLESAISLQGGRDYILNKNIGKKETLLIEFEMDDGREARYRHISESDDGFQYNMRFLCSRSTIEIKFKERGDGYTLVNNKFGVNFVIEKGFDTDGNWTCEEDLGVHTLEIVEDKRNGISVNFSGKMQNDFEVQDIFPLPVRLIQRLLEKGEPIFSQYFVSVLHPWREKVFKGLSIFDFSPNVVKSASPVVGKIQLEEDASNLPVFLRRVLKKSETRKRFVRLISDLLPFIDDVRVSETNDKSLLLELKESYYNKNFLPSTFLSDGTVHSVALISALYFDDSMLAFFEEPERNLHPALVQKVVDHMKSHSDKKQIFVTTHNAELLRNVEVDDVLFVSRGADGLSRINKISQRDDVQAFLENEIGLDEMYVQNLLG